MRGLESSLKAVTEEDARRIRIWAERLGQPLSIRFAATGDSRTSEFAAFCEDLQRLVPKLRIEREPDAASELPALHLDDRWTYRAVPRGGELPLFLELLSLLDEDCREVPEELANWREKIIWPAEVKIYVTPQCPFCPQLLRQLQPLPLASSFVHLTVVDGMLFPELAERDGVQSVPTVILDDRFRWTGTVSIEPILDALVHRDPEQLSTETLKGMIKEGRAEQVATLMVEANRIFPAFLELLTDSEWSARLGAMVVLEEIAERNPGLAAGTTGFIVNRLGAAEDAVKGDLVYLLGSVGAPECTGPLEELLEVSQDEQMQEVLREALEKLGHDKHPPQSMRGVDA